MLVTLERQAMHAALCSMLERRGDDCRATIYLFRLFDMSPDCRLLREMRLLMPALMMFMFYFERAI